MERKTDAPGLGARKRRDFYDLFEDNVLESTPETGIKLSRITPRGDQPRKKFDENALQLLADSIREHGVIQPIVVRETDSLDGNYEIIAGERRWRAARLAGLQEVPAVIIEADDKKAMELLRSEGHEVVEFACPQEELGATMREYDAVRTQFKMLQLRLCQQRGGQ